MRGRRATRRRCRRRARWPRSRRREARARGYTEARTGCSRASSPARVLLLDEPAIARLHELQRLRVVALQLVGAVALLEGDGRLAVGDFRGEDLHAHLDRLRLLDALGALFFPGAARFAAGHFE